MIHSFLLIGQSNMAGRGFINEVEPVNAENLCVLRNGRWQTLYVPVNDDRPFSGICLAESFAEAYAKEYDVEVGLIPCADGGTCLDQWQPGSLLYDHAVFQARLALRSSEIVGILWHQGEGDCADGRYQVYEEKCTALLLSMKKELGLFDVPILLGGLGDFLEDCPLSANLKNYHHVNAALQNMEKNHPDFGFVSAKGLTANPDMLHFNAPSLREFGLRYYEKFKAMAPQNRVYAEKENISKMQSEMEKL